MDDLEVAAECGVFVADRVEAVRARRDDLLDVRALQRLDVGLGRLLPEVFVADTPSRVAGAGLLRPEDRELHARGVEDPGDRLRRAARPVIERAGAADPVEPLDVVRDVVGDDRDVELEILRPLQPRVR